MGDLELNARFRTALKQGNVTRIEECLDQEAVDPNMKVAKIQMLSPIELILDFSVCSCPFKPCPTYPGNRNGQT